MRKLAFVFVLAGLASPGVSVSVAEASTHILPTFLAVEQPLATLAANSNPAQMAHTIAAVVVNEPDRTANMIICHENQAATGSRLGASRECHTKKEWDDRRAANQRTIDNAQQIGLTGNPPGN